MCGIFGMVGDVNSAQITFNGLKDIEYRGYDSWGIAYRTGDGVQNGKWEIKKQVGFLPSKLTLPTSGLAIGHTRWATHGGVTKINAHPHTDCSGKLVLVHNGIVENFLEIKKSLKGHKFKSETDTEVVLHLIEDEYVSTRNLARSVKNVAGLIKGLNAFVVSDGAGIVAYKIGSPLVVGYGEKARYIASDPNALLPFTKKLRFLEDKDLIFLDPASPLKKITNVSWHHSSSDRGKFPHFMLKEICEQPSVLDGIAKNSTDIGKLANLIKKAYGTFFIACGTASYACLAGVYLFSKFTKKHVNFSVGSEFNYIEDYIRPESLVLAVSQSGESIDTLEPILTANKKGANTAALVNVLGSTIYRSVKNPVLLKAGVEKAVASTKAMTAMLAYMILLSFRSGAKKLEGRKIISKSSKEVKKIIGKKSIIKKLAWKISGAGNIYCLGRGLSYPVALEAALKIKEISYIHAEGFAGGELKHGVIALIEKNTPVIVFAPSDETYEASISNAMEVKSRGAFVIGVGQKNNPVFDTFFKVENTGASSIIPNVVFAQLLAYYLALKLGFNPDKPRNLAKSVVVR